MRHLPPVYSPLSLASLGASQLRGVVNARSARRALSDHLAQVFDARSVVLTGSGTQALQIALARVASAGDGPPAVAMPAFACYDIVSAAVGAGVRVRLYDVDPETLSPDRDDLERTMDEGVTAVVAANLFGYPVDWDMVRGLCDRYGVFLIEDAAQGVGTDAGRGGTRGDLSVLSFGRGKGWTGGGGGAVLGRGPHDLLARAEQPAGQGSSPVRLAAGVAAWALGRPSLYGLPSSLPFLRLGETIYRDPVHPVGISGFSANLALATWASSAAAPIGRRQVAGKWLEALDHAAVEGPVPRPCRPVNGPAGATYLRFCLLCTDAAQAKRVVAEGRRHGAARGYPVALPDLDQARPVLLRRSAGFPGARRLAAQLVTLPTHQWVTDRDRREATRLLRVAPGGDEAQLRR